MKDQLFELYIGRYKFVNIKNPQTCFIIIFQSFMFWARKRNVSGIRFYYAPKTNVL